MHLFSPAPLLTALSGFHLFLEDDDKELVKGVDWFTDQIYALAGGRYWLLVTIVLSTALIAYFFTKLVLVRGARQIAAHTDNKWDDLIIDHHVFSRLSWFAPALVFFAWAGLLFPGTSEEGSPQWWTEKIALVAMVVVVGRAIGGLLNALLTVLESNESTDSTALRSYFQLSKILLWLVVAILMASRLLDKDPTNLLTGLGAMATVLLLIFKDSIQGFVASIQLTRDDLIRKGDWIEVDNYGANGDVMELTLHAVKVRNFDKTITTIPTPALITGGFKNWRGMKVSEHRRMKRAVAIDMNSIRFLEDDELDNLRDKGYLPEGGKDDDQGDDQDFGDQRRTNLGVFREYAQAYLKDHPKVNPEMTFLVRQLPSGPEGVPMELYVFLKEQDWAKYEGIIGDIFDHIFAIIPEFNLRVYQAPAGYDWRERVDRISADDEDKAAEDSDEAEATEPSS